LEPNVNRAVLERFMTACICTLAAGLGGCEILKPKIAGDADIAVGPDGTIAVAEMADRLALATQYSSPHGATLGDRLNSVVFFADPRGLTYVNGRQVGKAGGLVTVGDTLFVPAKLEREIRGLLRTRPKVRPPLPMHAESSKSTNAVVIKPRPRLGPVVIDPGHGGKDPGTNHHGVREKDLVLNVAMMAARNLRARGVDVLMTRSDDTFVELNDRAAFSNRAAPRLFVSLHVDWARNRRARGFTIYAPRTRMGQARAAAIIMTRYMRGTGLEDRGTRAAGFRVLLRTKCPALLIEMGYVSNVTEARLLARRDFQVRLSRAIASGILAYLTSQR